MRYLEIGCAPGRLLAWVAVERKAEVSGLDYSEAGIAAAERLFQSLGIPVDLRCEDVFANSFLPASFDVVTSFGLIEHFDNPRLVVEKHLELVQPGGVALIVIPNYRSIYGRLQRHFDPENLAIHNLQIMRPEQLVRLVPQSMVTDAQSYPAGRVAPGLVNFDKRWPRVVAKIIERTVNLAGSLQPFDVPMLSPLLVLQVARSIATH